MGYPKVVQRAPSRVCDDIVHDARAYGVHRQSDSVILSSFRSTNCSIDHQFMVVSVAPAGSSATGGDHVFLDPVPEHGN